MKHHAQLTAAIHRIWNSQGFISTLLLPLSWLTRLAISHKVQRYSRRPDRVWKSPIPVVIVGNIYVGGTGKTPVVMALVEALAQRGWRPGVISRGYGVRIGPEARTGQGDLDPHLFGDEPALIAASTHVPVAVHPSRVQAAQALMRDYPSVDVIVADDGLQHLALGRHAEIIVQDMRGVGNGRLLPAGPLREPATKLMQADVIVTNIHHSATNCKQENVTDPDATVRQARAASEPLSAHHLDNEDAPARVIMTLVPHDVIHVNSGKQQPWDTWLREHLDTPLDAVAAIGYPERFFSMLRHAGLSLHQTLALPDHTAYSTATFDAFNTATILMTTKDAVKCRSLNDDRLWAVRVMPHFSNTQWIDTLHDTLINAARNNGPDYGDARR